MQRLVVFTLGILFGTTTLFSQAPKKPSSSEIYQSIQKLNFLGTALYLAAHPDDENTRLISYLSNEVHAKTAYMSLTRGDGGQNLIGPELRELLGVLRTQELLGARSVDGGEQFFSRAVDFGFSKHPDETLKIWDKEAILGDVVRVIRTLRPDVIINRFDHRTPGKTHGHHTSSAILGVEAFDLANDTKAYPEQLNTLDTWQPKRIFFNTSWWFYGSQEAFDKADKSRLTHVNVGVYYPSLGLSNNEIASLASSNHLCQGFGRLTQRGDEEEYIELIKGDLPKDPTNIFDGINTTWSRIEGGKAIGDILYDVERNYDFTQPSKHLPALIKAYQLLQENKDTYWKNRKTKELKAIILAISGLYLEATTQVDHTTPNDSFKVFIEAINRSNQDVTLTSIDFSNGQKATTTNTSLENNKKFNEEITLQTPENASYSGPYWLTEKGSLGMYKVDNTALIGKPETPSPFIATFNLSFNGYPISFTKDIVYKYAKPDKGEIYEPFNVLPKVTSRINEDVILFASENAKQIPVVVKSGEANIAGKVSLQVPTGWKVTPNSMDFAMEQKGDEQTLYFLVTPPAEESNGTIAPVVTMDGNTYTQELFEIDYDHIPKQSVLMPSEAKVSRLNIKKAGEHIGYIMGAGDKVPESLEQIGYHVTLIDPSSINENSLEDFDSVVIGIRAYNVVNELNYKQRYLFDYVKNGGNLIVQYNTAGRWAKQFENIAPYPITLSGDRVTDENSEVTIINKTHSLVNFPNKIEKEDFNGWVQERGLYFPNEWDDHFTPILSMADKGESDKNGSILVAPYGKGNYIYTGLSFFRELPAGVSGAYKLFSNMLSIGKNEVTTIKNTKG